MTSDNKTFNCLNIAKSRTRLTLNLRGVESFFRLLDQYFCVLLTVEILFHGYHLVVYNNAALYQKVIHNLFTYKNILI